MTASEKGVEEVVAEKAEHFISSGSVLWYLQHWKNKIGVMSILLFTGFCQKRSLGKKAIWSHSFYGLEFIQNCVRWYNQMNQVLLVCHIYSRGLKWD